MWIEIYFKSREKRRTMPVSLREVHFPFSLDFSLSYVCAMVFCCPLLRLVGIFNTFWLLFYSVYLLLKNFVQILL